MALMTLSLPRISADTCPSLFSLPHPRPRNGNTIRTSEPPPLPQVMAVHIGEPQEDETWESPVQPVSAWRRQKKAEHDAGFASTESLVLAHSFTCSICSIGIGKNHCEQELYLLPILPGQRFRVRDTTKYFKDFTVLYCCGGCARRHHLSESQLIVPASTWEQTAVLSSKDIRPLVNAFKQVVFSCLLMREYFLTKNWHIPITLVPRKPEPQPVRLVPTNPKPEQAQVAPRQTTMIARGAPLPSSLSAVLSSYHPPILHTHRPLQKAAQ